MALLLPAAIAVACLLHTSVAKQHLHKYLDPAYDCIRPAAFTADSPYDPFPQCHHNSSLFHTQADTIENFASKSNCGHCVCNSR
jgi:hypothetical protein